MPTATFRHHRAALVLLFVVAAGLRVGWVAARYGPGDRAAKTQFPDEDAYVLSARSLAAGNGLVDEFGYRATYMPAYPAFLALFRGLPQPLLWTRLAQALLAAWVAPATFLLASRFLQSQNRPPTIVAPLAAGLLVALDPFLLYFSGLLLTEALFAAVLVSAWVCVLPLVCRHSDEAAAKSPLMLPAVAAGALLCFAVMLRPAAAFLAAILPGFLIVARRADRRSWISAAVISGVFLAGLLPWAVRNRLVVAEWIWLTTRGGISLYDGWRPGATGGSDLAHTKTAPEVVGLSETAWDDHFRQAAWRSAAENPARILALAGRKFLRTWSLKPNIEEHSRGASAWLSLGWMLFMLAAAALGLWLHRRRVCAWATLLLPVVVTTLVHMVFIGSVRYRVPVMPMLAVLAGAGIASAVLAVQSRLRQRSSATGPGGTRSTGSQPGPL